MMYMKGDHAFGMNSKTSLQTPKTLMAKKTPNNPDVKGQGMLFSPY